MTNLKRRLQLHSTAQHSTALTSFFSFHGFHSSILIFSLAFCLLLSGVSWAETVTLSGSENYTANDGDTLTGSTTGTVTITNNATITLSGAAITGGILCAGNATIILDGENTVTGSTFKAGIEVGGSGTTLTIKGDGSLTATGDDQSAGIGLSRAWDVDATGGDIVIEGGNITANGSSKWGAGIGTGVVYGASNGKTARLGNITIKGGNVKATGGTDAYGIGTGHSYSNCTNEIGTITIYDDVDIVDASSITESVTYMHDEDNVTANAGDYFNIFTYNSRKVITKKDGTTYTVSIADGITGGTIAASKTEAQYGEIITLTITLNSGYNLQALTAKDSAGNDIPITDNRFLMPRSNVTISAAFTETTASFNESTGVLTLCGNVVSDDVKAWRYVVNEYGGIAEDSRVTSVACEPGAVLPADCSELFRGFNSVVTIDLRNADTSNVIDTSYMFAGNDKLTTIYVSNSWSMENVTSSDAMFAWCTPLWGGNGTSYQNVYNSYYQSNGNDPDAAALSAGSGEYAIIDGKDNKPGYLTFAKATPAAPRPNALTYTGEPQALVKAGDGTMTYSLDGTNYSAEIPTGTDAGTYTVYYRVEESDNWEEAEGSVEAEINPIVVTFNANGHGIAPDSQSFTALNEKASRPDDLTAKGYRFGGWYTDSDCTEEYDFDSEVNGNLTLYAKWTEGFSPTDESEPQFVYHSLILSGQIGVMFYVYIPENVAPESCTMDFDVSGDISQNNPGQTYDKTITDSGYTLYGYRCYINSVQMADDIHAELTCGDETITQTFTAKEYLDGLIADESEPEYSRALGRAIMNYGSYVQPILADYNKWVIGVKHRKMTSADAYTASDFTNTMNAVAGHAISRDIPDDLGIEDIQFSLVLDSETAIKLYLTSKDGYAGSVCAYLDGNESANMAVKKGRDYVVEIGNISAHKLADIYAVKIVTGNVEFTVKVSALSYVQAVISDESESVAMKEAVTSIYEYYAATMEYRRNRPEIYGGGD